MKKVPLLTLEEFNKGRAGVQIILRRTHPDRVKVEIHIVRKGVQKHRSKDIVLLAFNELQAVTYKLWEARDERN